MTSLSTVAVRRPVVAHTRADLAAALAAARSAGDRVALVPTMGALHVGHASLMREARQAAGPHTTVVASIFVNPMQFGPNEDLARYPRSLDADLEVCAANGVDLVFAPGVKDMYPDGETLVSVDPGRLGTVLEGATRPTHFRGVLTVVAKLIGLVRPDMAVFGEKDYQQLVLIRRMVDDLCLGVEIIGGRTVREADGLALSSRNAYLDHRQRALAIALSEALRAGADAAAGGAAAVLAAAHDVLQRAAGVQVDYLALTSPGLGDPPPSGEARLLVEARVGSTRLLDNIAVTLGDNDKKGN